MSRPKRLPSTWTWRLVSWKDGPDICN